MKVRTTRVDWSGYRPTINKKNKNNESSELNLISSLSTSVCLERRNNNVTCNNNAKELFDQQTVTALDHISELFSKFSLSDDQLKQIFNSNKKLWRSLIPYFLLYDVKCYNYNISNMFRVMEECDPEFKEIIKISSALHGNINSSPKHCLNFDRYQLEPEIDAIIDKFSGLTQSCATLDVWINRIWSEFQKNNIDNWIQQYQDHKYFCIFEHMVIYEGTESNQSPVFRKYLIKIFIPSMFRELGNYDSGLLPKKTSEIDIKQIITYFLGLVSIKLASNKYTEQELKRVISKLFYFMQIVIDVDLYCADKVISSLMLVIDDYLIPIKVANNTTEKTLLAQYLIKELSKCILTNIDSLILELKRPRKDVYRNILYNFSLPSIQQLLDEIQNQCTNDQQYQNYSGFVKYFNNFRGRNQFFVILERGIENKLVEKQVVFNEYLIEFILEMFGELGNYDSNLLPKKTSEIDIEQIIAYFLDLVSIKLASNKYTEQDLKRLISKLFYFMQIVIDGDLYYADEVISSLMLVIDDLITIKKSDTTTETTMLAKYLIKELSKFILTNIDSLILELKIPGRNVYSNIFYTFSWQDSLQLLLDEIQNQCTNNEQSYIYYKFVKYFLDMDNHKEKFPGFDMQKLKLSNHTDSKLFIGCERTGKYYSGMLCSNILIKDGLPAHNVSYNGNYYSNGIPDNTVAVSYNNYLDQELVRGVVDNKCYYKTGLMLHNKYMLANEFEQYYPTYYKKIINYSSCPESNLILEFFFFNGIPVALVLEGEIYQKIDHDNKRVDIVTGEITVIGRKVLNKAGKLFKNLYFYHAQQGVSIKDQNIKHLMFVDGEGNLLHGYFRISNWRSWLKDMMPAEEVSVTKKGTVVNLTICPGILTIFPDTSIDKEYTRFINGKLAFGMFDGRLYEEGKPFEGHKDDKYYKNGVPYTGFVVSEGGYYKDGELFTGLEQGIYYNKGITSAGKYNGILYGKYGKPFTGFDKNIYYENGVPLSGEAGNTYYVNGKPSGGTHNNRCYSFDDGKLLNTPHIEYKNSLLFTCDLPECKYWPKENNSEVLFENGLPVEVLYEQYQVKIKYSDDGKIIEKTVIYNEIFNSEKRIDSKNYYDPITGLYLDGKGYPLNDTYLISDHELLKQEQECENILSPIETAKFNNKEHTLFKNGKLFSGIVGSTKYLNGKIYTEHEVVYNQNGELMNGIHDGIYYKDGERINGKYNNKYYNDGKLITDVDSGQYYYQGSLLHGTINFSTIQDELKLKEHYDNTVTKYKNYEEPQNAYLLFVNGIPVAIKYKARSTIINHNEKRIDYYAEYPKHIVKFGALLLDSMSWLPTQFDACYHIESKLYVDQYGFLLNGVYTVVPSNWTIFLIKPKDFNHSNNRLFKDGKLFTGFDNHTLYEKGEKYTGLQYNRFFNKGLLFSGYLKEDNNKLYLNGTRFSGKYKDQEYKDGSVINDKKPVIKMTKI